MMTESSNECPVCKEIWSATASSTYSGRYDVYRIECEACGIFILSDFAKLLLEPSRLSPLQKATTSHIIRTRRNLQLFSETKFPFVTEANIQSVLDKKENLPAPNEQLRRLIGEVGNYEQENGDYVQNAKPYFAKVGCSSVKAFANLAYDAQDQEYIKLQPESPFSDGVLANKPFHSCRLTLKGWQYWEDIRKGQTDSSDGFIAMQFGDKRLDAFVETVIQAGVFDKIGRKVHRVDSPSKTRAGLIDNIMREAIEDAAFVLVELSHGNKGAYWEAGLAEGLRKPVIYLCEQKVWDEEKTRPHFDVNHRTTIMWSEDKPDEFLNQLVNTIQNSLRLHGVTT